MQGRSFYRGWLGVQLDPHAAGSAVIQRVADPSPLREADVKPGDRIIWAEGRDVHHFGDLVQAIYMIPAGEQVYLTIEREGLQFGVDVKLARNTELGPLPETPPAFDPSNPFPMPPGQP
jgi:S1-C subfamily serine protease